MIWLLGLGKWLREAATALFGVVARHPWQAALIASLCLSAWLWWGRNEARDQLAQRIAAEKSAAGAQKRVNDAAQAHYTEKANEADTKHEAMVAEAFDATQRFIDRHRVQPADRACKAPAPASGDSAPVHVEVPAAGVVVAEADVQRCAAWQAYGVAANEWAQSLSLPENLLPEQ